MAGGGSSVPCGLVAAALVTAATALIPLQSTIKYVHLEECSGSGGKSPFEKEKEIAFVVHSSGNRARDDAVLSSWSRFHPTGSLEYPGEIQRQVDRVQGSSYYRLEVAPLQEGHPPEALTFLSELV